jgi:hypothetical protein
VTYIDGQGKSGQYYASKYAEENAIGTQSIISPSNFSSDLKSYIAKHGSIAAVVVVDDIVATGRSIERNLTAFCQDNRTALEELKVPLTLVALFSTKLGEQYAREAMNKLTWLDGDLRVCDLIPDNRFAFSKETDIWKSPAEREEAKSLCVDLGARIYPDNPLGFGDQGLLIVFPDTCPNNSLPILHSESRKSESEWIPIFPRLTN